MSMGSGGWDSMGSGGWDSMGSGGWDSMGEESFLSVGDFSSEGGGWTSLGGDATGEFTDGTDGGASEGGVEEGHPYPYRVWLTQQYRLQQQLQQGREQIRQLQEQQQQQHMYYQQQQQQQQQQHQQQQHYQQAQQPAGSSAYGPGQPPPSAWGGGVGAVRSSAGFKVLASGTSSAAGVASSAAGVGPQQQQDGAGVGAQLLGQAGLPQMAADGSSGQLMEEGAGEGEALLSFVAPQPRVLPSFDVDYSGKILDHSLYQDTKTKRITTRSVLRLGGVGLICTLGAFLSVSPRNAPWEAYMPLFRRNLGLLGASLIGPFLISLVVYDGSKANVNAFITVLTFSFTGGYLATLAMEIVQATFYSLAVYAALEPSVFDLCPKVPVLHLPWIGLAQYGYSIKPVTSFIADFAIFCFGAPIIEEVMKVWITRHVGALPPRKEAALAAATTAGGQMPNNGQQMPNIPPPTHVHTYLVYVMGAALGLKAADNARRVLLFTRPEHHKKLLFAFLRGFFPLPELCAGLTAMALARKEILGEKLSSFRVFGLATLLHAWVNFRGHKPMFKWRSDSPWNELQMQAWVFPRGASLGKLLMRGFGSLVWISVVLKVLAQVIQTYWRLNRLHNSHLRQQMETRKPMPPPPPPPPVGPSVVAPPPLPPR